jgi:hypothetical protein
MFLLLAWCWSGLIAAVLPSAAARRYGPGMYVGAISGDPDEVIVSTNDPDLVTVWMGASGATDLTREAAEELAALLMRAVRELGG